MAKKAKSNKEFEFKKATFIAEVKYVYDKYNDFDTIKKILWQFGINASFENNMLWISTEHMEEDLKRNNILPDNSKNARGAGRKSKEFYSDKLLEKVYTIGDFFYKKLDENKFDRVIADEMNMSLSTFYRRKKELKQMLTIDKGLDKWYEKTLKEVSINPTNSYDLWHDDYGKLPF